MAATGVLAPRMVDYWWTLYKRTWKGSAISSFVNPLLYVVAMGVLLGGFVTSDPARLEGAHSYLAFVAPGMVAAQAMSVVFGELTYPVMGMIRWHRTYFSMIATPLAVRDVVLAQLGFVLVRVAMTAGVFLLVMAPFGAFSSAGGAVAAFFVQLLLGLAFATVVFAFSTWVRNEQGFSLLYRLGLMPLFLFSGAFFPIANLDPVLRTIARVTPLWQGVDLTRMLTVGDVHTDRAVVHVAYLAVMAVVGYLLAVRNLRRRLVG